MQVIIMFLNNYYNYRNYYYYYFIITNYSFFSDLFPCFLLVLQLGQYHFPFSTAFNLRQSTRNHCMSQVELSHIIISPDSAPLQRAPTVISFIFILSNITIGFNCNPWMDAMELQTTSENV